MTENQDDLIKRWINEDQIMPAAECRLHHYQRMLIESGFIIPDTRVWNVDLTNPQAPDRHYLYPQPLTSYEKVAADSQLFHSTLENLHATMGNKLEEYPSTLDLHKLFLGITSGGGGDMAYRNGKWDELAAVFGVSSNELRKNYVSFLYHYEAVYFHRARYYVIMPEGIYGFGEATIKEPEDKEDKAIATGGTRKAVIGGEATVEQEEKAPGEGCDTTTYKARRAVHRASSLLTWSMHIAFSRRLVFAFMACGLALIATRWLYCDHFHFS